MYIYTRTWKDGKISATTENKVWQLIVRIDEVDQYLSPGTEPEEWVARRLCRSMWPSSAFDLNYVGPFGSTNTTMWYAGET